MKKAAKKRSSSRGGKKAGRGMKRTAARRDPPMRGEYDFSRGVRGKYAKRFAAGSNVVVLEPDVASAFPTAQSVNSALRRSLSTSAAKRGGGSKRRTA